MSAPAVTDAKLSAHIRAVEAAGYRVTAVVIGRHETRLETAPLDAAQPQRSNRKPREWTDDD